MSVEIGNTIVIRELETLIGGAKGLGGKQYLNQRLIQSYELSDVILFEIKKISARKFVLSNIVTGDNSYDLEDEKIYFTAHWYDIKRLNEAVEVEFENELLGTCTELRVKKTNKGAK